MEIGKYIGKFLLKNKYCSLPGLGVFELKKIPAYELKNELKNPSHLITFTPVGSIDDTFASFIASFENVSISNAANNIKEYCRNVKEEISKTGKFEIESLGKLTSQNGKLIFHQSDDLDLGFTAATISPIEIKPIASEPQEKVKEDFSYPPANTTYLRNKSTNWAKIAIPVVAVLALALISYFGYNYLKNNTSEPEVKTPTEEVATVQMDTVTNATAPTITDSNATSSAIDTAVTNTATTINDTANAATVDSAPKAVGKEYKISLFSFTNEPSATAKANKLSSFGNKTSVVNNNGEFIVALMASHPLNDTAKLVDSVRRFFNPKGQVHIMK